MGRMSDLDIDRRDAEGVFTAFAAPGLPCWPLAGWVAVARYSAR